MQKSGAAPVLVPGEGLTEQDLRRQLEGRVEAVEQVLQPLDVLEKALSTFFWKSALRANSRALRDVISRLNTLQEAEERILRRAESGGWSADNPILELLKKAKAAGVRVDALARKRLGRLKGGFERAPLGTVLERLETLALAPLPSDLRASEVRLLEGRLGDSSAFAWWPALIYLPAIATSLLNTRWTGPIAYALLFGLMLWAFVNSGRFWLTTERLLWKPRVGEPVEIPLASIADGGVQLKRAVGTVLVSGTRDAAVRFVENADKLAVMLEVRRAPPLADAGVEVRTQEVAVYSGRRMAGAVQTPGTVVLRPSYAAFLPEGAAGALLAHVRSGGAPAFPMNAEVLLQELRCLPEAQFDAALLSGATAAGGSVLERPDSHWDASMPAWSDIRLVQGEVTLHGSVDWRQIDVADRILRGWRR